MVQSMFRRTPSSECNHSKSGVCSKCVLQAAFNLNNPEPTYPPAKNDSQDSAGPSAAEGRKEALLSQSTILSFDQLQMEVQNTAGVTLLTEICKKEALSNSSTSTTEKRTAAFSIDSSTESDSGSAEAPMPALNEDSSNNNEEVLEADLLCETSTTTVLTDEKNANEDLLASPVPSHSFGYTSFASLGTATNRRRITEEHLNSDDESDDGSEKPMAGKSQTWLLRFFESSIFDVVNAMQYLHSSKEPGIISYLGNRLFKFPASKVNFYIPQLITMYINRKDVASAIHPYILQRCRESVEFALECYWLLEAYSIDQNKTRSLKGPECELKQAILKEMASAQAAPDKSAAFHHRSHSDATMAMPNSHSLTASPAGMRRTDSALSVRSTAAPGDLSSGRAFDDGCRCSSELDDICQCDGSQKTRPILDFVQALITIGDRLKQIALKEERSKRLLYELFMLNLNLPARVWLPLYAESSKHVIVRIPHTAGCVLNSKDKAPFCIYVEVMEVDNIQSARLPGKIAETDAEVHRKMRSPSITSAVLVENGKDDVNKGSHPLLVVQQPSNIDLLNDHEGDADDSKFTHFDKMTGVVDEECFGAASDSYSELSVESDRSMGSPVHSPGGPTVNPAQIRSRLSALMRRRRKQIVHCPEDPSASTMSEPWSEKVAKIRETSPYGHFPCWRLLSVIVKTGDDLRQELLAYQLLTTLQNIWKEEQLSLYLRPYRIFVCSHDSGMIEPIPNASSLHQIKKNLSSTPTFDDAEKLPYPPTILSHFLINYGSRLSEGFRKAQRNFVRSCAAYCLACYFLQVKDRHNGNILLDSDGYLIHIDFGYILSISPRNLGFETSPFKLTQELIDVMGGVKSDMYEDFKKLMLQGLIAARKHHERLLTIVEIMLQGSQLPCFRGGAGVLRSLKERFHLNWTDQQLQNQIDLMVEQSRDSLTTRLYDNFQYYTNGIF